LQPPRRINTATTSHVNLVHPDEATHALGLASTQGSEHFATQDDEPLELHERVHHGHGYHRRRHQRGDNHRNDDGSVASSNGPMIPAIVNGRVYSNPPHVAGSSSDHDNGALENKPESLLRQSPSSSPETHPESRPQSLQSPPLQPIVRPASPQNRPSGPKKKSNKNLPGISYAPYAHDNECKTAEQIAADVTTFTGVCSFVRIYGVDCEQIEHIYEPAKRAGLRLFLGIYDIGNVEGSVHTITASPVGRDWAVVHTISVGNERVNSAQSSTDQVVAAVDAARSTAGYGGSVVAVDTFVATRANPDLCNRSDYCAINAHAFFTGTIEARHAGDWLAEQVASVRTALADKAQRIVVAETGWPHAGAPNAASVPGLKEQADALANIRARSKDNLGDIILFSAFNDLWKPATEGTFFAEPWWGIGGGNSTSDE
jgi:exo-beta-1,3-glucanase (GH17 family)